jgi:hypothetical protein
MSFVTTPRNDEAWVRTLLACFCARAKARLQVRTQEFSEEYDV